MMNPLKFPLSKVDVPVLRNLPLLVPRPLLLRYNSTGFTCTCTLLYSLSLRIPLKPRQLFPVEKAVTPGPRLILLSNPDQPVSVAAEREWKTGHAHLLGSHPLED